MDWKTDNSLKSLNWSDILHKPSDDEYDSDETICELNISLTEDAKKGLNCNRIENINTKLDTKMTSSPGFPDNIVSNDHPNEKSVEHNKWLETKLKEPANEELYSIVQLSSTLQSCSFVEKIPSTSQTEENMNQTQNIDISYTSKQHENKQYSTLTPGKQMRRMYPKITPKKSLPMRKCHSTFIINSLHVEVEEGNESSSETDDNEINTNNNSSISDNEYRTRKEGNNGSRKRIRRKTGRKRKQIKDNSLIDDLNRFEVELNVMEDKVERWITGKDEESPSRQQAFEMLAQSQNLAKLVEMRKQKYLAQQCPKNEKLTKMKILVKRTNIVSGVIDKAIAEADRLMNLEETITFDTTLEQDVGMVKTSQGSPPLKSILKHTSTVYSEKSIAYSSKHVSFSDKVDYRYISCSDEDSSDINYNSEKCSTNDVNCSFEEIRSNEICENVDRGNLNYNTNKTFSDEDIEALQNTISNEKVNGIEEENMMDVTNNCVTNINPDPNTLSCNIKTVQENTMKNYTDNDKDNVVAGNATVLKLYELNSDVHCSSKEEDVLNDAQLQDSSIEPVDTDENTKNDGITSPCSKNPPKNHHTKGICNSTDLFNDKQPLGNSEISLVTSQPILTDTEDSLGSETFTCDENSYGFSKMENKFDWEAWNNITIMSIKEIRVRGNDEYSRVADASFCADDFRW